MVFSPLNRRKHGGRGLTSQVVQQRYGSAGAAAVSTDWPLHRPGYVIHFDHFQGYLTKNTSQNPPCLNNYWRTEGLIGGPTSGDYSPSCAGSLLTLNTDQENGRSRISGYLAQFRHRTFVEWVARAYYEKFYTAGQTGSNKNSDVVHGMGGLSLEQPPGNANNPADGITMPMQSGFTAYNPFMGFFIDYNLQQNRDMIYIGARRYLNSATIIASGVVPTLDTYYEYRMVKAANGDMVFYIDGDEVGRVLATDPNLPDEDVDWLAQLHTLTQEDGREALINLDYSGIMALQDDALVVRLT